jgi:anti-sigma factor RsiW
MEWLVMQAHDGQLPERRRAEVTAHLADCRECRNYLGAARSASAWLRSGGPAPEFSSVWQGVAGRLPASIPVASWWSRWRFIKLGEWSFRPGWLAAGSLAVALLLLLVNPYGRLPLPQSHEAVVAFVEVSDYPVIVMMPSQPHEMTVIWLFEPLESSSIPPT